MEVFLDIIKNEKSVMGILLRVVIILLFTFILTSIIRKFWKHLDKDNIKIHHRFLYNILIIMLYFFGVIIALSQIPAISETMNALLAGSGIVALAIGLAAQESLGNLINGMVISIAKPFEVGDRIHLINGNITGYIEDITLRHTIVRTFVNSRIIVPNSTINKDMIENSSYEGGKASSFIDVVITFDSDMKKAVDIIGNAIKSHPEYVDARTYEDKKDDNIPMVEVYLRELGINGVMLRASMWTESTDNNFKACSDVRYIIKEEFDKAGILLAQLPARPSDVVSPTPI